MTTSDRENFLMNESKILDLQKISIIKKTTPKHLTLKLQDKMARRFGAGRVQLEFKKLKLSNKKIRINTLIGIGKTKKQIEEELFDIRKQRENLLL